MDFLTANNVYCKNKCSSPLACQRKGYTNPKTCTSCICPDGFAGTLCNQLDASSRTSVYSYKLLKDLIYFFLKRHVEVL